MFTWFNMFANIFSQPDKKLLNKYPGKWGAKVTITDTRDFLLDIANQDYIVMYKIEDILPTNVYIPMWDNQDKNQYDFIVIERFLIDRYIKKYDAPLGKELYRPPYLFTNSLIGIRLYEKGGLINKLKMYPYFYVRINLKEDKYIAYNTKHSKIYVLKESDIEAYVKEFRTKLNNLFYISIDNLKGEPTRYPDQQDWTFNWEGIRKKNEKVTILPKERSYSTLDKYNIML